MEIEWLYSISQWITLPLSGFAILGAAMAGQRLGQRLRTRGDSTTTNVGTFEAALIGLLSLMIGFTFSLALTRFEARNSIVLNEANAIGTAYTRAALLPSPYDANAAQLLRNYLDARVVLGAPETDPVKYDAAVNTSLHLQELLWQQAQPPFALDARSGPANLFVQALNDLDDIHEERLTANQNHVPEPVFVLLYSIAIVAMGFAGYAAGLSGTRSAIPNTVMAFSI